MKRFKFLPFILCLCVLIGLWLPSGALALDAPTPASRAAIVVDRNTGEVFYERNADQLVYPASTTKIMTALLAIEAVEAEQVSIYDEVTASENMTYDLIADGSTAGIVVGETMTLEDLLYCAMLSSANEACNVIGEYIAGTIPAFIQMMNQRAAELGCTDTHFANTHGLPNAEHYTTANDFIRIAQAAVSHDLFMDFCGAATADIPATNMNSERHLKNSNALICADSTYGSKYVYPYAEGIKTGFTSDAGYCLVSAASNGEIDLLCAVFGGYAYTDSEGVASFTNFEDSILLYEWVFNNFSYQEILKSTETVISVPVSMGADADAVKLRAESSIVALLPNDSDPASFTRTITIHDLEENESLVAPVSAGQVLGEVNVSRDGVDYGTTKLVAASSIELSRLQYMKTEIQKTLQSKLVHRVFWILVGLLALYLLLVIRYRVLYHRRKRAVRRVKKAAKAREAQLLQARAAAQKAVEADAAPPISYFSETGESAPAETVPPEQSEAEARSKADRDYFEEFFRQK